jgi:plasmid stabilization system protein ParE
MTKLRVLPEAEEELRAATLHYEAERAGLGRALLTEVRRSYKRISEFPLAARKERGEIRALSIARFPYRIYYRVGDIEIVIIAIGHNRRRPGFWRERVAT